MSGGYAIENNLLKRILTDPLTGLPSVMYFRLIREWEERRARRRDYNVSVLTVEVQGGTQSVRRTLGLRLCRDFRTSDLIASDGNEHYRVLLTTPDAEQAEVIRQKVSRIADGLNEGVPADQHVALDVKVEGKREGQPVEPCQPCDLNALETPAAEHRPFRDSPRRGETDAHDEGTTSA
jgi:GGDEF domain-containing protein